ncbi:hypothetical protein WJ972_31635 [Achromobacter insuavis]
MAYEQMTRGDLIRLLEQYDVERAEAGKDGIIMSYTGRTAPWQIIRQVKPKLTKINQRASVGEGQAQGQNIIMDGENLSGMVTLYKYRGQVDLILTDPPTTRARTFATTTSGTRTLTIPNWVNWCRKRTVRAIPSGYGS